MTNFVIHEHNGNPSNIFYNGTAGFQLSNEVLILPKELLDDLAHFVYKYEFSLRNRILFNLQNDPTNVLFQGQHHNMWQKNHKNAFNMQGLVRLDLVIKPNGECSIFEVQPRPGGLGIQTWIQESFGYETLLVKQFTETVRIQTGKENPLLLFLITTKKQTFMKEMRLFVDRIKKQGLRCEMIQQKNGPGEKNVQNPEIYDAVYVRGRFDGMNLDVLKLLELKKVFVVSPSELFSSKAALSVLDDGTEEFRKYVPHTRVVDHSNIAEMWEWRKEDRSHWVIKPSNDWGAAEIFDVTCLSETLWRNKLADSLKRIASGESPFLLQKKVINLREFPERPGAAMSWIGRICFTLGRNSYHFAGGMWNARLNTIRIHGASDTLVGLVISSEDKKMFNR